MSISLLTKFAAFVRLTEGMVLDDTENWVKSKIIIIIIRNYYNNFYYS
jgi:hypothetical protein